MIHSQTSQTPGTATDIKVTHERAGSRLVRALWVIAGSLSLVVGIVGIFLPIVPTTSPLLLAAFCFARGSSRLNNWLLNHPHLGPPINSWKKYGAISRRAKIQALVMMVFSLMLTWVLGVPLWVLAVQALALTAVAIFLVTRPSPPR